MRDQGSKRNICKIMTRSYGANHAQKLTSRTCRHSRTILFAFDVLSFSAACTSLNERSLVRENMLRIIMIIAAIGFLTYMSGSSLADPFTKQREDPDELSIKRLYKEFYAPDAIILQTSPGTESKVQHQFERYFFDPDVAEAYRKDCVRNLTIILPELCRRQSWSLDTRYCRSAVVQNSAEAFAVCQSQINNALESYRRR